MGGTTTPVIWNDIENKKEKLLIPRFSESFESDRLLIRAPKMEDVMDVWNAICHSLPALREWMPFAQSEPELESTENNLREAVANFITRKDLRLHLFKKDTGEFIGSSGLHRIDWSIPKFEIGYWLASEFEGQGYMKEAVERIEKFAFDELGARRVEIRCDEENIKSRKVAERAGFILEGTLKNDSMSMDGSVLRNTCIYAKIDSNHEKR